MENLYFLLVIGIAISFGLVTSTIVLCIFSKDFRTEFLNDWRRE